MKRMFLSMMIAGALLASCSSTRTTSTTSTNAAMGGDSSASAATGNAATNMNATTTTTTTTTTTGSDTSSMGTQNQSSTTGQNTTSAPDVITRSFTTRYPSASGTTWSPYNRVEVPIDWEMTGWRPLREGDYVAQFNMNGQQYYAWYDANGNWIGSSAMLANTENLPAPVRTMLASKYSGYTVDKVDQEYDANRMVYEIKLKKGDNDKVKLHVTDQGVVVKEKKKD